MHANFFLKMLEYHLLEYVHILFVFNHSNIFRSILMPFIQNRHELFRQPHENN